VADILIRDIDEVVLKRLKKRAKRNKRSLQAELKTVLERASMVNVVDAKALAERIRLELSGHTHSDSAELIAEDRRR